MDSDNRTITAHIPVELAAQIDTFAEKMERPRGWIVKEALADWIEAQKAELQLIHEGVLDFEAGRLVANDEILSWIDSLEDKA